MDEQLDKELRFHMDQHATELMAQGHAPDEARRMARMAIGGPEQVREHCREARGTRWLEDLVQDFRYALRTLWHNPGFAAVILLTLALGTGATTVMFTVINGVLLKPLPYAQPDRLLALQEKTDKATRFGDLWAFAYPNFLDCKRQDQSLTLAAWRFNGGAVTEPGPAEYVEAREVSSDLFPVLGVALIHGRAFLPEEDRLGGAPAAIISYGLWQRRFGGGSSAMGKPIVFGGKTYTIVGITPAGFRFNGSEVDLFVPLGQNTSPNLQNRDRHPGINVVARLHPRVTLDQARTELRVIGRQLAAQYPASNTGRTFIANPLRPNVGDAGPTLWLLLGAVSLVLLIACANVANLLLARAVSRQREFSMRAALGASRGRLVRQCLTESSVLGLAGGALGVLLATAGIRPFITFWPGSLPRAEEVHVDWRVLLFALAVSLLSGLLFGLVPTMRIPVRSLELALRAGARSIAGHSRRLHGSFVISEITLAVVLLVSAGILGRTILRLSSLHPGVDTHNVLVTRMALSPAVLANPARIRVAWQDVLDHALRVPGVQSAAAVDTVPLREGNNEVAYATSAAIPKSDQLPIALATSVTPDYLKVMGIPLLKGRFVEDHDRLGSELVVIIDDVLARQAFGKDDPVGKQLWLPGDASPFSVGKDAPDVARVIGVVGHVRYWGPASDDQAKVRAQVYYPFAQVPDQLLRRWSELMSVAVRTSVPPLTVLESVQHEVSGATGDQVLYEIRTMDQLAAAAIAQQRFLLMLFSIFAGLALLLACVGIYGVLAYLTSQRVPEFGVRMALGATAGNVMRLVLRQSVGMIVGGIALGLAAAVAAGRLLEHLVAGVRSTDPLAFAMMIAVLIVAALAASFIPARRASRVDPVIALRQE